MPPIQFDPNLRSNARVHVRTVQGAPGDEPTFTLTKPSKGAFVGKGALNLVSQLLCFIPGAKYNKNWRNPSEWAAFRNAVLTSHASDISQERITREELNHILDTTFSTYSAHKRLTQGKAATVLEDVRRAIDGQALRPRAPNRLNASQAAVGRGFRTLWISMRGCNAKMQALRAKHAQQADSSSMAIRNILRPGRTILNTSVTQAHQALEKIAAGKANFEWSAKGTDAASVDARLTMICQVENEKISRLRNLAGSDPRKPSILSIPLILEPKTMSLHERHVVELAVDFRAKKLLYLDAKGESVEDATANYDAGDVRQAPVNFGRNIFGAGFDGATDIVQMTQAKQKGANDCGAFTHDFAHRLIDGQSVGDIERSLTADDRARLRLNMAQHIDTQLVSPAQPPGDAGSATEDIVAESGALHVSQPRPNIPDESFDMMDDAGSPEQGGGFFDQARVKGSQD